MESLTGQPAPSEQRDSVLRPVLLGVALVVLVIGIVAVFWRGTPKAVKTPPPYAANVKLSDLKKGAAENFIGASVFYLDGTITNTGDKTLTHAVVRVLFLDSMAQVVQNDEVALHVLKTDGPYLDTVDLSSAPLSPGQSKPFRLTFEHISNEWNQDPPQIEVIDVAVK